MHSIVETGSYNLHHDTDPETVQTVMQARAVFYEEVLGWGGDNHPLHNAYEDFITKLNIRAMPIATFIQTQRMFNEHRIDNAKVVNGLPAAIGLAPESVRIKFNALQHAGYITKSRPFPCNNKALVRNIFILPAESIPAYIPSAEQPASPDTLDRLATTARRYMKSEGATSGPERKQFITDNYPHVVKALGIHALEWAGYNKRLVTPGDRPLLPITEL